MVCAGSRCGDHRETLTFRLGQSTARERIGCSGRGWEGEDRGALKKGDVRAWRLAQYQIVG